MNDQETSLIINKKGHDNTASLLEAIIHQNEKNNPTSLLENQLEQGVRNSDKIVEAIKATKQPEVQKIKLDGIETITLKGKDGDKGDKGDSPTEDELVKIIKPLIPEPIKGEDGKTPTEDELKNIINPLIPKPIEGAKGDSPTEEELKKIIEPLIPEPLNGKDGSPDTPKEIKEKLESLENEDRLDISAIKGIEKIKNNLNRLAMVGGGGAKIFKELADVPQAYIGQAGKIVKVKTSEDGLEFGTSSGSGDVVGPASATDGVPALFDGTTGKLLKNSTPTGTGNPVLATSPTLITPILGVASATSLGITGTAGAGFVDLIGQSSQPSAPAAGTARFHSATSNGFTRPEFHNESLQDIVLGQDSVFLAKNTSGGAITKGQVVYASGSVGAIPTISLAKSDLIATINATIGVAVETSIANNGFGYIMLAGIIDSINTSAFTAGDILYVSSAAAGALVNTKPAYPNFQKGVGVVLNSGVGNGSILINVAPFTGGTELGTNASTFYATALQLSGLTATELIATDASKNLVSLGVVTYPSLTEISYVKGVTSAIQTQIDGKSPTAGNASLVTVGTVTTGVWNGTDVPVSAGGTGLSTISALSIWLANSANTITEVTPGAGNSIRINAGGTAWEAFTPGTGGGISESLAIAYAVSL